jgi:hypothetical protein
MMRSFRAWSGGGAGLVLLAALVVAGPAAGAADDGGPSPVATSTPDEVRAVVQRLFDGMRQADSAMVRSVFADGARFASLAEQGGREAVQYPPVDDFVQAIAGSAGRWDERLVDVEIRVDAGMAIVWAPYSFYLDGQLRHCGVNVMDLLRVNGEWRITQLTDTRRTEGCRELPE